MTRRRALPALYRDLFCLFLGGGWGTYTVVTAGPWPLMLVSAVTMMGPGFLKVWLSGNGTGARLLSQSLEQVEPSPSSSSGSPMEAGSGDRVG